MEVKELIKLIQNYPDADIVVRGLEEDLTWYELADVDTDSGETGLLIIKLGDRVD